MLLHPQPCHPKPAAKDVLGVLGMAVPLITHCRVKAGLEGMAADLGRSAATFNHPLWPSAAVPQEHGVHSSKASRKAQVLRVSCAVPRPARAAFFILSGQGTQ